MKKLNIFLTMIISLLLAFPPAVLAGTVGTITYIEGRVDRRSVAENDYFPLVVGENIMEGDVIRTKSYSKAEVAFNDNSIVRLGGSTQIRVKDYEVGKDGYRKLGVIDLDRGRIRAIVSSTPEEASFDINTLNALGSVKGSDIFVSFLQSTTSVLVAEGVFSMTNPDFPDQRMDVSDGMASFVPHNAPPEDPRAFIPAEKDKYEAVTGPTVHMVKGAKKGAEFTMAMVAKVTGTVRVQPKGSKRWHTPVKNEVLNMGDKIETGSDGWILISFDNGLSIELRENTQLMIIQLARDLKTGDYDNIFESQYGEIISKLQNKPEKSTFEIKTPHAVCGVRGTIMYLKISPGGTKSFFEGGEGSVTDLLSGKTRVVQSGITFTIDEEGNTTETQTSDEERSEFGSEPGNEGEEEYGYTDPDSTPDNTGAGDPPVGEPGGPDIPVDETVPFDDVKPGIVPVAVVEPPYIWLDTVISFYDDGEPVALYGVTVGIGGGTAGMEGAFAGLYMDSSQNVGYVRDGEGGVSGTYNPDTDTWEGESELVTTQMGQVLDVAPIDFSDSLLHEDLKMSLTGDFKGQGSISGQFDYGRRHAVNDKVDWGIFEFKLNSGDYYDRPSEANEWSAFVGISDVEDNFYQIVTVEGSWANNEIRGEITGRGMDHEMLQTVEGDAFGVYNGDSAGAWVLNGAGVYYGYGEPLTYLSELGIESDDEEWGFLHFSFDLDEDEEEFEPVVTNSGEITGLMGGTGPLWSGSADVTLIGEYNVEDKNVSNFWALPVYSFNHINGEYTTYNNDDGVGAYYGALFGFYKDDNVEGFMRALYVGPDGNIGYVSGGFSGPAYPESDNSGMFFMEGELSFIEKGSVSEVVKFSDSEVAELSEEKGLPDAKGLYAYCEDEDKVDKGHLFAAGLRTNIDFDDLDFDKYDGVMEFIAGASLSDTDTEFMDFISNKGKEEKDFDLFVGVMFAKAISFQDVGWGIWGGAFLGAFAGDGDTPPSDSWILPFFGMAGDEDDGSDYDGTNTILFGRIEGTEWTPDGRVAGEIRGIWVSAAGDENGNIELGKISGEVAGENEYIDAGEEFVVGTWEAAAAGEWVEVDYLLEVEGLLDLAKLTALELKQITGCDFISIPFTETLSYSGDTGIRTAFMNVALFAQSDALIGMWAAEIAGTYDSDTISENWSIIFNGGEDTGTLVNVNGTAAWEDTSSGNWSADVSGTIEGNQIFGEAAGTYTYGEEAGKFKGVGVGGWIDKSIVDIGDDAGDLFETIT